MRSAPARAAVVTMPQPDAEERRPGEGAASKSPAKATSPIIPPGAEIPRTSAPEVEARQGDLLRLTRDRRVVCVCSGCGWRGGNTGSAASHARSTRHRVEVHYETTFAFVAGEALAGAVS